MKKESYKTLFSRIDTIKNGDISARELSEKIERHIYSSRLMRIKIKIASYLTFMCIAVLACIPVIQHAVSSANESGFSSYFSLILSDWSYLLTSWRELTMTLIESFPVLSSVGLVALILIFVYSLSKSMLYIKTIKTYHHHLA